MTRSMTAFARIEATNHWGRAAWEMRSVNHRYLEIGLRLPEDLRHLEGEVRARIGAKLNRGKVDCTLRFDADGGASSELTINESAARLVIQAAQRIAELARSSAPLNPLEILRWPKVLETPQVDQELLSCDMLELLDRALSEMVNVREREGVQLQTVILQRCEKIGAIARDLRTRVPEIIAAIRARHTQRIQELATNLDPARLETECALLIQRLDVAEELDRLDAHLVELQRVMQQREPIGRRLDFLLQELNREANTLGSKSAHIDTSGAAIELKVLLEQIREQIQNIE